MSGKTSDGGAGWPACRGQRLMVDGLQIPTPERRWFEEWHAGGLGCVHATMAVWEGAKETLSYIAKYKRVLLENADIVEQATTAEDIVRIAAAGKTAVLFGFQNTAPIEHDIELFRVFRDLGFMEQMEENKFPRKYGAVWTSAKNFFWLSSCQ